MGFRARRGRYSVDIGPKDIVVRKGAKEPRTVDLEEVSLDLMWTPAGEPREGPGEVEAYVFHPIGDYDSEIWVSQTMGVGKDEVQGAWNAMVQIIKEHDIVLEKGFLRYFKHRYHLGLRTGLEDYYRLQHSKMLANPRAERGDPILWSARLWRANAIGGLSARLMAITPILAVSAAMLYALTWPHFNDRSLMPTPPLFLAVIASLLILLTAFDIYRLQRAIIPRHGGIPGLYANGLQLTNGDGFVPFSEMRDVNIAKGHNLIFHLRFGHWPDGTKDEQLLLEDAYQTFPGGILGRDGADALLGHLDRSQMYKESLRMWEERSARSRAR